MNKKIIILISTFFCINNIAAIDPLSPQENTKVYNFIKLHTPNNPLQKTDVDLFLKTNNISAQKLYRLLKRLYVLLENQIWHPEPFKYFDVDKYSGHWGNIDLVVDAVTIGIPTLLSTQSITVGLLIKPAENSAPPSTPWEHVKSPLSTSLIALGSLGLLPAIVKGPIGYIIARTKYLFENLTETITHNKTLKNKSLETEMVIISNLKDQLKSLYPDEIVITDSENEL